jgi:hypothetical protein
MDLDVDKSTDIHMYIFEITIVDTRYRYRIAAIFDLSGYCIDYHVDIVVCSISE